MRNISFYKTGFCALVLMCVFIATMPEGRAAAGQCQAPSRKTAQICEEGGAFLCLNRPIGSVNDAFVILKGRFNLINSALGQISLSTQHEYTKELHTIRLTSPQRENCWENALSEDANFCLEEEGRFALRAPLEEIGPYTIYVAATRMEGSAAQKTVRVSRVIAPTVTEDAVTYEPDILNGTVPAGTSHVRIILDLLKGCGESGEVCDFIGAATGGLLVNVINRMETSGKEVECGTDTVQGGVGRFVVGLPVEPGENKIEITVCNAATGFDTSSCPKITPPPFTVGGSARHIQMLSPLPEGSLYFESQSRPSLPLRFRIPGEVQKECGDSVRVALNTKEEEVLCPDAQGVYEIKLLPEIGYNIAVITVGNGNEKLVRTVPFGWGNVLSLFDEEGKLKPEEDRMLKQAIRLRLSENLLNEKLLPVLNDFLSSEEFPLMLGVATNGVGQGEVRRNEDPHAVEKETIRRELGYCPAGGGLGSLRIKMIREPKIGKIRIEPMRLSENKLSVSLQASDVSLAIQLYKDENGDGKPDIDPLPLKIGFATLEASPIIKKAGERWVLSSEETDCAYKRDGACLHMPALLVPRRFRGNADSVGAFAVCDRSQKISEKMDSICHSINVVDRQTGGVLQEKILDALNSAYACTGTAAFNILFQEGRSVHYENEHVVFDGTLQLEDFSAEEGGLGLSVATRFGEKAALQAWPEALRKGNVGILSEREIKGATRFPDNKGLSFDMALPLVSQIFWGIGNPEGGEFDLTVDTDFFAEQGFNFEEKCVVQEGEKLPALCNIRPRAQEVFGSVVSGYGYLAQKDPLIFILRPSKAFPFRIETKETEGDIGLALAHWELEIRSEKESIITAYLSAKIGAHVTNLHFSALDPDHYQTEIALDASGSKIWLTPKEGSNKTVIPDSLLLSNLSDKLKLAIDTFAQDGKEIKIALPRFVDLTSESLFSKIGLNELTWGRNGFRLDWNNDPDRLQISLDPVLR